LIFSRGSSPRRRPRSPVIVTAHPSEDHTYSLSQVPSNGDSPASSIDEEYDFGHAGNLVSDDEWSDTSGESDYEDCMALRIKQEPTGTATMTSKDTKNPAKRRLIQADDEDEEMKIVEGADALLNLAGIKTSHIVPLRSISPLTNNNNNNNSKPPMIVQS